MPSTWWIYPMSRPHTQSGRYLDASRPKLASEWALINCHARRLIAFERHPHALSLYRLGGLEFSDRGFHRHEAYGEPFVHLIFAGVKACHFLRERGRKGRHPLVVQLATGTRHPLWVTNQAALPPSRVARAP